MTAPIKASEKFFLSIKYDPKLGDDLVELHDAKSEEEVPEMITNMLSFSIKNVWKSIEQALRNGYRVELHVEIQNGRDAA